ncbi:MAG: hypothetical protein WCL02_04285 [bacterium]
MAQKLKKKKNMNNFNLENMTISGSTVQNWQTTASGSTASVFTSTTTERETTHQIVLTGPARTNQELYVATGGIISPNVYTHFVRR